MSAESVGKRVRLAVAAPSIAVLVLWGLASAAAPQARAGVAGASWGAVPPAVAATIASVTSKPTYRHSSWGVAILDPASRKLLYGLNADQMFVPGSVMKVYSTTTALQAYGPNYRFRTPVYRDGPVRRGVLRGNLDLVASGDFTMGLRERPGGNLAFNNFPVCDHSYAEAADSCGLVPGNPLAAVQQLARRVRAAGIRRVTGNVVIDDRLFTPFNGWPDGLISPIWINENLIDATSTPTRPGRTAGLSWRPRVAGYSVTTSVRTVSKGKPTDVTIASPTPGVIKLSGTIAAGARALLRVWQITDPAAFARTAFIQALRRNGVAVSAPLTGPNPSRLLPKTPYRAGNRVGEHVSAPLSQFVKVILNVSYNRGADLMVCLAAVKAGGKNCEQGLANELHHNVSLGVNPASTYAFDGAGSDDNDKTTPTDLATFLANVATKPYGSAFRAGLPVLGRSGTLATVEQDSPAAGHVQLKDGTRGASSPITNQFLLTANAIGGYVDAKSGRQLVIAIFVNNVPVDSLPAAHAVAEDQGAIAAEIQQAY